ncbi:MAG: MarR family winged helix-turn-helix transcriptional regulator [Chitinophagales bacterium]
MTSRLSQTAQDLMDTVPPIMRFIREEMRRHSSGPGSFLSVPQVRGLAFLSRRPGAALTEVAEHLGVTAATASSMVERLVQQGLVERRTAPEERRRHCLTLTARGEGILADARSATRRRVEAVLAKLSPDEQDAVAQALPLLAKAFR